MKVREADVPHMDKCMRKGGVHLESHIMHDPTWQRY
jgi:hypothetical protein